MGTKLIASLAFTLIQLSLATLAREISSAEGSFKTDKPSEAQVPIYPAQPEPAWMLEGHPKDNGLTSEEKEKKWKEMAVWGKRDQGIEPEKKWNEVAVWGKRDAESDPEKKWKEMAVWGKRGRDSDLEKKWKEMAVWGKRDGDSGLEKKWKEMAVWGKRGGDSGLEKKWKEMAVWGKRSEGQDLGEKLNNELDMDKKWKEMAVWGKRDDAPELDKKWKEMAVWGKRSGDMDLIKKWKEMAVWGKRQDGLDKRWKEMAVWGKRFVSPELVSRWKAMGGPHREQEGLKESVVESPDEFEKELANKQWNDVEDWEKYGGDEGIGKTGPWDNVIGGKGGVNSPVRRKKSLSRDRWWRVRQKMEQMTRKRPSWSNTGFNSWGKRADHMFHEGLPAEYQGYLGM